MPTRCVRCNRPLSDPQSIARGMGPVCANKAGLLHKDGMGTRSFHDARVEDDTTLREALVLEREPRPSQMDLVRTNVPHLVVHYSPTGFEWGYGGSGPADLALNIMYFFIKEMDIPASAQESGAQKSGAQKSGAQESDPFNQQVVECFEGEVPRVAWDLHQPFKDEVIAQISEYGTRVSADEIRQWILNRLYDAEVELEDVPEFA